MIQFKRSLYKLDSLYYDYVDDDPRSRNVFRVLTLPDTFKLGKNEFRMLANNEVLVKGSKIYMDIVDSVGNAIYYEISPIANKDGSRSVVVYIYPDTPSGECRIVVAGRLGIDPRSKEKIYYNDLIIDEPNVKWSSRVNVSPYEETDGRIRYLKNISATYTERTEYLQVLSGSSRLVQHKAPGNSSISMKSVLSPATDLSTERSELFRTTPVQPKMVGDVGRSETVDLPYFTGVSMLSSTNFPFSSSMRGGVIEVNGISVNGPLDATDQSVFSGITYTASIVRVVSDEVIEVFPPFQKTISWKNSAGVTNVFSATTFTNQTNFTASFYDVYPLSSSLTTQSFLEINTYGIEPISGILDSINVSYKPINSFGDYVNLGDYRVVSRNILTDSASLSFSPSFGIVERSVGTFPGGVSDFQHYWESGSNGSTIAFFYDNTTLPIKVSDGLLVKTNVAFNPNTYIYIRPKSIYSVFVDAGTECVLKVASFLEAHELGGDKSQIDVYISGSKNVFSQNTEDRLYLQPIKNDVFGKYIGSLTADRGALRTDSMNFYVREAGNIRPVFVLRSGHWHFGNIELMPRQETGFSPNQTKLYVPLIDVDRESELAVRLQYNDRFGIRSDRDTVLYGIYFTGSSPIQYSEISNAPAPSTGGDLSSGSYYYYRLMRGETKRVNNSVGNSITVSFPIFTDADGITYDGTQVNVGIAFQVDTSVLAITGSPGSPFNSYAWAGTVQGRASIIPNENTAQPNLYNVVAVSSSTLNTIGTFGNGHATKTNLDSWFKVLSVGTDGTTNLVIRYNVITTSSFMWDANLISTCQVWKYETNLA